MRALAWIALSIGLGGCGLLPERKTLEDAGLWPDKTKPWCAPRISYKHERRRVTAGVRCWW